MFRPRTISDPNLAGSARSNKGYFGFYPTLGQESRTLLITIASGRRSGGCQIDRGRCAGFQGRGIRPSFLSPPPGRSRSRPRAGRPGARSRPASRNRMPVGFEPVRPAVEGETRVVLAHLLVEGRRSRPRRCRAGSRRSGRRGLRPHRPSRRRRNGSAPPTPFSSALARAVARAPGDRSIPRPVACGSSCRSATRRQPDPVPKSTIRRGACRSGRRSRAVSTTVSVSGRGTRVSGRGGRAGPRTPALRGSGPPAHGQAAPGEGGEGRRSPRRSGAYPAA